MGLFTKKQQVIKFEQNICNASVNDNSVLFVRVNDIVKVKNALFEVPFTHNAFLIKGGGDCRFYRSGTYPVFDDSSEIKAWKIGVSVEVIYIPKETSVLIRWGTPNKVKYKDPVSYKVIEVGARGQFGVSVSNPEQFFRKIVGATKEFDLSRFSARFSAAVVDEFADVFLTVVNENNITYDVFDAKRKTIATKIGEALSEKFTKDYGIALVDFIIENFNISDEDISKIESVAEEEKHERKMKEYLAELERLDDKQWEREKYLLEIKQNDRESYYEVLKVIGAKEPTAPEGHFCPNCGHSVETDQAFCPSCGHKLAAASNVCSCGHVNDGSATFCSACGKKLG